MYDKKTAQTIGAQLESLCQEYKANLLERAKDTTSDMLRALELKELASPDLKRLNQVLFASRAFDTGLRIFLECFDVEIEKTNRHIKGYLNKLANYDGDSFAPLKSKVKDRIIEDVVYERNRMMHVAGKYPQPRDVDGMLSNIADYLSHVLHLKD